MKNLISNFRLGLDLRGSSRTKRYVRFDEQVGSVSKTIFAIMNVICDNKTKLEVGGSVYDVREYVLPTSLVDLVKACRIFVSPNSYYDEPWFKVEARDADLKKEDRVLTPYEMEKFFHDYNYNQEPENSLDLKNVEIGYFSIFDLQGFFKNDALVEFNPSGAIPKEVSQILEIEPPFTQGKKISKYSDQEVALWLTKKGSVKSLD